MHTRSILLTAATSVVMLFLTYCSKTLTTSAGSGSSITIGHQVWTTRNLDVSTFRNRDSIPHAATLEAWVKAGEEGTPAWCYYDNDPANGKIYGKLYNWYAVTDKRGLAPAGWHVPASGEWNEMVSRLGGSASPQFPDNSGFNSLPGGRRFNNGPFSDINRAAFFWTTSEQSVGITLYRQFSPGEKTRFIEYGRTGGDGCSVRCVRD